MTTLEGGRWKKPGAEMRTADMPSRLLPLLLATATLADDPYETYVRTSEDFRPVQQDKDWALKAWPSWTYMPWTHQWTIGYDEASGRWSREHGYNGAFIDHGSTSLPGGSKTGRLDWIEQHGLRFYVDHLAGKGSLHLFGGGKEKAHLDALHGNGVRLVPLNEATAERLREQFIRPRVANVRGSPLRAAYAFDDEVSWGHFVHPTMWQVTDDDSAYPRWLESVYGAGRAPKRDRWHTYEDLRGKLKEWSIAEFDASPLLDQWSFNDSHWGNFLGGLVEFTNSLDPDTPCGIVGGQSPNAFGGYDYAKLMRKVQFIESYNLGSSQAVIRSFNPGNALPAVTTHFHKSVADSIWQTWYYLAHGNRGFIGWVQDWFDGATPKDWHAQVAPTYREAAEKIGPLMRGATWRHDGVALYYNHASIQLAWILDAEAHGKTWVNRNADERLASSTHVRRAWENLLRDAGLQYNFLSYVDVIQRGVPEEYRVLILPACLCLSDAEARALRAFVERGGTLIADYLPGVWDQHGRGRRGGGVLDDLFGVRHDPALRAGDVFGEKLWVEVDQDANYSWKSYEEFLSKGNTSLKHESGFHLAVRHLPALQERTHGRGRAVLMNLSPQWYNAWRVEGAAATRRGETFLRPIRAAGLAPEIRLVGAGEAEHGHEITRWRLPSGRELLFLCLNPEIRGNSLGGGNSVGLKTAQLPVTLRFAHPVHRVRDERAGRDLGDGSEFRCEWTQNEAVVLSYEPARP